MRSPIRENPAAPNASQPRSTRPGRRPIPPNKTSSSSRLPIIAGTVLNAWGGQTHPLAEPYVVCTGGEPLLQLDAAAIDALHTRGLTVAVETNGTQPAPPGLDWVCVSPKAGAPLVLTVGDDLKLVFPQDGAEPEAFEHLEFGRFLLQPMDGPDREKNTRLAVEYCLIHPQWRLSLQTHKYLGIA
jgi:7-carboxy-7-deazaguanine synthase